MTSRQIDVCWTFLEYLAYGVSAMGLLVFLGMLSGCASLAGKSVGAAGTVTAIKLESAGSASTAAPLPNVLIGGAAVAVATSPDSDRRAVYVSARRTSTLARLLGLGVSDEATVYIGAPGDTADSVRAVIGR